MNFELSGKIIEIMPENQVSDRFKKQEFVIEKVEQNGANSFTDYVKFQLTQDRTTLINPFSTGDEVKVSFNIRGNRWNSKGTVNYFTNLDAWKIESLSSSSRQDSPPPPVPIDPSDEIPGGFDDLPF
jgi:hypothetical protein